jgi:hypothetical protein
VQPAPVAQPAGHGELGAGREQPRTVGQTLVDGVADRDIEPDLCCRSGHRAGETRAQHLARGIHGEDGVILGRQLAEPGAARRVDERQMRMALDHAGHQELAPSVDLLRAACLERLGLRRHGGDPVVLDQHLARERRGAAAVPDPGIVDQQSHAGPPYAGQYTSPRCG